MAHRNLTDRFKQIRQQHLSQLPSTSIHHKSNNTFDNLALPFDSLKTLVDQYLEAQKERIAKPSIFGQVKYSHDLDACEKRVSQCMVRCKQVIGRLQQSEQQADGQERLMINNRKSHLMRQLMDQSQRIRNTKQHQKDVDSQRQQYMSMLKSPIQDIFDVDSEMDDQSALLLAQQDLESEISVNDTIIRERQKELDSVLNQIVELGDMMQEMNSMVVEQGTLLDRIDFNIDVAGQTVKKANNNLDQSERIQQATNKVGCCIWIVVALIFFIVGMIGIVAIRLVL